MKYLEGIILRTKQLMQEKGIESVGRLAKLSGIADSTLRSIFNGETETVGMATVFAICQGLQVGLDEFYGTKMFSFENITD